MKPQEYQISAKEETVVEADDFVMVPEPTDSPNLSKEILFE